MLRGFFEQIPETLSDGTVYTLTTFDDVTHGLGQTYLCHIAQGAQGK